MITEKTIYMTSDNREFSNMAAAEEHEKTLAMNKEKTEDYAQIQKKVSEYNKKYNANLVVTNSKTKANSIFHTSNNKPRINSVSDYFDLLNLL